MRTLRWTDRVAPLQRLPLEDALCRNVEFIKERAATFPVTEGPNTEQFAVAFWSDDVFTYGALIAAHGKIGCVDTAFLLFAEMEEAGVKANVVTYGALMNAFGKEGRLEEAFSVFEKICNHFH